MEFPLSHLNEAQGQLMPVIVPSSLEKGRELADVNVPGSVLCRTSIARLCRLHRMWTTDIDLEMFLKTVLAIGVPCPSTLSAGASALPLDIWSFSSHPISIFPGGPNGGLPRAKSNARPFDRPHVNIIRTGSNPGRPRQLSRGDHAKFRNRIRHLYDTVGDRALSDGPRWQARNRSERGTQGSEPWSNWLLQTGRDPRPGMSVGRAIEGIPWPSPAGSPLPVLQFGRYRVDVPKIQSATPRIGPQQRFVWVASYVQASLPGL